MQARLVETDDIGFHCALVQVMKVAPRFAQPSRGGKEGLTMMVRKYGNQFSPHLHQFWGQVQHQARFCQGCMEPLAALGLRDQGAEPFRATPEETGQHGQAGNGAAQLAGCGLEQGDLAAMAVEQNESLESGSSPLC
jgi:hypothetical protein